MAREENSAFLEYSGSALSPKRVLNSMKQNSAPLSGRGCPILEVFGHFYSLMNSSGAFISALMLAPFLTFPFLLASLHDFHYISEKWTRWGCPFCAFISKFVGASGHFPCSFLLQRTPKFLQGAAALFSSYLYTSTNHVSSP